MKLWDTAQHPCTLYSIPVSKIPTATGKPHELLASSDGSYKIDELWSTIKRALPKSYSGYFASQDVDLSDPGLFKFECGALLVSAGLATIKSAVSVTPNIIQSNDPPLWVQKKDPTEAYCPHDYRPSSGNHVSHVQVHPEGSLFPFYDPVLGLRLVYSPGSWHTGLKFDKNSDIDTWGVSSASTFKKDDCAAYGILHRSHMKPLAAQPDGSSVLLKSALTYCVEHITIQPTKLAAPTQAGAHRRFPFDRYGAEMSLYCSVGMPNGKEKKVFTIFHPGQISSW